MSLGAVVRNAPARSGQYTLAAALPSCRQLKRLRRAQLTPPTQQAPSVASESATVALARTQAASPDWASPYCGWMAKIVSFAANADKSRLGDAGCSPRSQPEISSCPATGPFNASARLSSAAARTFDPRSDSPLSTREQRQTDTLPRRQCPGKTQGQRRLARNATATSTA